MGLYLICKIKPTKINAYNNDYSPTELIKETSDKNV